jgi:hypothetical protein
MNTLGCTRWRRSTSSRRRSVGSVVLRKAGHGNPIENIGLIEDPAKSFLVIMKDGKIYKNALTR